MTQITHNSTYADGFKRYRVVGFEHDGSAEILSSFDDKTDAEHSLCWFLDDPDADVYLMDAEDGTDASD